MATCPPHIHFQVVEHKVDSWDRQKYKFIDDLSTLEMLNLVMCGISSYNFKHHVASDIGVHGQYLAAENIQSPVYLDR